MLYDYVTRKERLKQLQPIQKRRWYSLFSRFKKNKLNRSIKKVEQTQASQLESLEANTTPQQRWVLERHMGQSFWIGDDIQIVLLGYTKGVMHIGVKTRLGIRVVKAELDKKGG